MTLTCHRSPFARCSAAGSSNGNKRAVADSGPEGNGSENWRLRQLAKGVAETLDDSSHRSTSALKKFRNLITAGRVPKHRGKNSFACKKLRGYCKTGLSHGCPNSENIVRKWTCGWPQLARYFEKEHGRRLPEC